MQQAKDTWDKMIFASTIMAIPSISFKHGLAWKIAIFYFFCMGFLFNNLHWFNLSDNQIQKHYKYCCIARFILLRPEAIFFITSRIFVSSLRREFKSTVIYLIVMMLLLISVEVIDTA